MKGSKKKIRAQKLQYNRTFHCWYNQLFKNMKNILRDKIKLKKNRKKNHLTIITNRYNISSHRPIYTSKKKNNKLPQFCILLHLIHAIISQATNKKTLI